MSGGSFDYLYIKEANDLLLGTHDDELQRMADDLAKRGHEDAAQETMGVLLECRAARVRIETRCKRLADLWHAVEWHRSCDYRPEQVEAAYRRYAGSRP